ncbi:DUF2188 domain-containing protein [Chelativorans sp. M5D2P16]|uniref:DUF2188 domain-containing protein n=1 Tax=Chelativorans sp. M5D2P16 TaxID=3095678 RepID=UPI002ACA7866|nr:DUF2188 domain-containing protein [Chelativorans sp. M5D2P16]MDZ5697007.1 DUF2188 domain-containing protein [Chelativorans sp. M5D2P16]
MRFVLLALGTFGLYRFLKWRKERHGRSALLSDMRGEGGPRGAAPVHVTYEVVEHDGGWAYKVDDVYSETFATRREADSAARQAAAAHESAGSDTFIQYQDGEGRWHEETEPGEDRPETEVRGRPATG